MTMFGIIFFVIIVSMVVIYVSPIGKTMRKSGKETTPMKQVRYQDPTDDPTDDRIPF